MFHHALTQVHCDTGILNNPGYVVTADLKNNPAYCEQSELLTRVCHGLGKLDD